MLNIELISQIQEIEENIIEENKLRSLINDRKIIILKAKKSPVAIGEYMLVKVNTNIGISSPEMLESELDKLDRIINIGYSPDTIMDHTITKLPHRQFYEYIIERFRGPVGTLPHYLAYSVERGIDEKELLEIAHQQAESGVSFMTLHPTSTLELYEKACATRKTPMSSRGGGIVISDMLHNKRKTNIIEKLFPDLLNILQNHNMALSVGSTFRPTNIMEALDEVHRDEIILQGKFIKEAKKNGVPVQMEGIGHIPLNQINEYFTLISPYKIPMMPLGPLPTDAAIGQDHISNAIGASYACLLGGAHIINSITREEHTGGVPSVESIIEGLKAARIAAHSVNISRFPILAYEDNKVADLRAKSYTCVVDGGLFSRSSQIQFSLGCTRCGKECPLRINKEYHK